MVYRKFPKQVFPCVQLSLVNSPSYKLAPFLLDDQKNAFPLPTTFHVNNRFKFVKKIRNLKLNSDDILISLDATFLFDNTYILFDAKDYSQIKGCPMDSSISGLFGNLVIEDLQLCCLESLKNQNCESKFYFRYVDDAFACVKKEKIGLVINKYHSTVEKYCI